jgi:antirestriction protein ArdC
MATVYEIITERITGMLEAGTVPWRKPWSGEASAPASLASGKKYRGVNAFMLAVTGMFKGYGAPYWVTYKQATERGGNVRKGEKGTPVVFWTRWTPKDATPDENGVVRPIPLIRYYTVFNVAQCDGVEFPAPATPVNAFAKIEAAQAVIDAMPMRPEIVQGGHRACYAPALDTVYLPSPEAFEKSEAYYATAFHELGHSTGHAKRVGRKAVQDPITFASHEYSQEELVAEMTAAFLCGHTGIEAATLENSAAYIDHWLKVLRGDSKLVVIAAAQAQKAADYILGVKFGEAKPEEAEELAEAVA